jgi:hypothetical protein
MDIPKQVTYLITFQHTLKKNKVVCQEQQQIVINIFKTMPEETECMEQLDSISRVITWYERTFYRFLLVEIRKMEFTV